MPNSKRRVEMAHPVIEKQGRSCHDDGSSSIYDDCLVVTKERAEEEEVTSQVGVRSLLDFLISWCISCRKTRDTYDGRTIPPKQFC